MLKLIAVALGMGSALFGECMSAPESREGRLEVIATDLFGERLQEVEVELFDSGNCSTLRGRRIETLTRLRYGHYRLRVWATGFGSVLRDVVIFQPEVVLRVDLTVGSIGCPPPPADIGGRIVRKGNSGGDLWVKVIALRGTEAREARVGDAGFFLISGLDYTTYLVVVMEGEKLLHQRTVKTFPATGSGSGKLLIELR